MGSSFELVVSEWQNELPNFNVKICHVEFSYTLFRPCTLYLALTIERTKADYCHLQKRCKVESSIHLCSVYDASRGKMY